MKKYFTSASWILIIFALAGCATVRVPQRSTSAKSAQQAWTDVLKNFVDQGGDVDFEGLAKAPEQLETYISFIAQHSPENSPEMFRTQADRLAYYLNSYNALSMYNVLDSGIPKTNSGFRKIYFFALKKFVIGGRSMTLKTYEDSIIRKQNEPRVHFTLNCMARSCPQLLQVPFESSVIEKQLQDSTLAFFRKSENFNLDTEKQTVTTSEILSFFPEDFVTKDRTLIDFINLYSPEKVPASYQVKYTPYDWTIINQQK